MRFKKSVLGIGLAALLQSCAGLFSPPVEKQNSTLGEVTPYTSMLRSLPEPKERAVVAVYKFRDQTGQYKAADVGTNWSTAIPQGTTAILIKALEDSKWFTTIERENIGNLLNERQIIKTTRQEFPIVDANNKVSPANTLPPLLYAGVIIEGGIVSYDTNIMTGGIGARYFGIGGSSQYRQDRITVYLRIVSTQNGRILKNVYTSKTILSQAISGNFFRYVDTERLMEAEVGVTKNEPVQLAVKEAIEKAVYALIIEGIEDSIWEAEPKDKPTFNKMIADYHKEEFINDNRRLDNRILEARRGRIGVSLSGEAVTIKGDYTNPRTNIGGRASAQYFLSDRFSIDLSHSIFTLENEGILKRKFAATEINLQYYIMPYDRFTPYLYAGAGSIGPQYRYFNEVKGKAQAGAGLEYLIQNNFGLKVYGEYDFGFSDDWDDRIHGKHNDQLFKFGLGLTYYFGNRNTKTTYNR